MNEKQIGDLIRTRRQELKISQDYVATRCGVTKSTVSRWETGYIKKIKRGDIFMLSRILYLPAETILYGNKIDCILPSAIVLKQKKH